MRPASQSTPAGRYKITLDYTRIAEGLKIDWSMISVNADGNPLRTYSHLGSIIDTSPASSTWTYNQLGFFLLGSSFTGSITMDDILVAFTDMITLDGDYNLDGIVDAIDYTIWRDSLGQTGVGLAADGNGDEMVDSLDYDLWKLNFGMTSLGTGGGAGLTSAVPEPSVLILVGVAAMAGFGIRSRTTRGISCGTSPV